jgi:hypothetical protein
VPDHLRIHPYRVRDTWRVGAVSSIAKTLNGKGQCCGRKPIVYKREPHLFCHRCCRSYDPDTGKQIGNWAWIFDGEGFVPKYPDHDYARLP